MDITSRRNCKVGRTILTCLLIVCVLCGCDPYCGKRPQDYKNSKWVCEDPDIMITVSNTGELDWTINGTATKYELALGNGTNFWIYDYETARNILEGDSSYSSTKMSVFVHMDLLFDGKYEGRTIVFRRVE